MARVSNRVLLGYEDEPITDKYKDIVDYTTNKVGGKPNWPGDSPTAVTCKLCGLHLPLVLQIYAPLNYSLYHRTLYVFACINPNCWNQNGSWVCLRSQTLEIKTDGGLQCMQRNNEAVQNVTDWCSSGDNWDDDEENGNTIEVLLNRPPDDGLSQELERMCVDDRNANCGGGSGAEGAMGLVNIPTATIEGDEGEVVCIDTPTSPQVNLVAILEEAAPLPQVPVSKLQFSPFFLSVGEEELNNSTSPTNSEHIKDILKDYQITSPDDDPVKSGTDYDVVSENYEKSIPAHGDKMFYHFLTRIQKNPGQILRYGGPPLLLYPLQETPKACTYCGGDLAFELQILPSLIPKLKLTEAQQGTHLEFGSVFLFSCRASCWDSRDSFREEILVVQLERI